MSELEDLAADLTGDMPPGVRKTINTAIENGWQLNKPGMTVSLRLNHPTDELAQPVYITWVVSRTPKGKLSFKFFSCGTQGLVKLTGADLLEYLQDPTVIYNLPEDAPDDREQMGDSPAWNDKASEVQNLSASLGAKVIRIEKTTAADIISRQQEAMANPSVAQGRVKPGQSLRVAPPVLRVKAP